MKILHLSDTHFSNYIDDPELMNVLIEQVSIKEKLHQIVTHEDLSTFNFVCVSGDIVHEGTPKDYQDIKSLLEEIFCPLPIYYCLGNHDKKDVFYQGMGIENITGNFDYDTVINDIHMIFLDSAKAHSHAGILSTEQLAWLENTLKSNSLQKMIFQHHPIIGGEYFSGFTMENPKPILDILSKHEIIGVFTGHTHSPAVNLRGNVLQYTTYAMSFGLEKLADGSQLFTDTCGYSVIEYIPKEGLTVAPRIIQPTYRVLKSTNPQEMHDLNRSYEQ